MNLQKCIGLKKSEKSQNEITVFSCLPKNEQK